MKTILVEEWVHIPEGGKQALLDSFYLLVTLTVKTR